MKFETEKDIEVILAEVDRRVKPLSLDSTILNLVGESSVSVRLGNCFRRDAAQVNIAKMTIREYLNDKSYAIERFTEIRNFGRRTALELDNLINYWIKSVPGAKEELNVEELDDERTSMVSSYTLEKKISEIVSEMNVSQRLKNFYLGFEDEGVLPFVTVKDYLDCGKLAYQKLLTFKNLGRKTVLELHHLVLSVCEEDKCSQG